MRGPIPHLKRHVATFVIGCLAAIVVAAGYQQLAGSLVKGKVYKVRAMVGTAASLAPGSRVTMAGADVGRVGGVKRQGFGTVVALEITDERVTPIPMDSRVTIRQRTPVGENFVAITPGDGKRMLGAEDVLPVSQSDEYVDVDQLLSTLQGKTSANTRKLIQSMGTALGGRGEELNATLGGAHQVVDHAASVLTLLRRDQPQTNRLVDNLGRVMAAVGDRREAVAVTARRGLAALEAVASRDTQLAAVLRELPPTLRTVRATGDIVGQTSRVASPVVTDLTGAVRDLRPAIDALGPAAVQGQRVVRELGRAAPPLRTTLEEVERLSGPLGAALPQVRKTLCQVNPMLRYAQPYIPDVPAALIGLGSASNSYDAVGHLIRLTPIAGENSLAGAPANVSLAAQTLTRAGFLGKSSPLTWHPYPDGGRIGQDAADVEHRVSGPAELAKSYKFPHVVADC